jgi:replicative DNA helicase
LSDELVVQGDVLGESIVVAAAMADPEARSQLVRRLKPDRFQHPSHRAAWEALCEVERRKLEWDLETVARLFGDKVDTRYLAELSASRPGPPPNLEHHVEGVLWDSARAEATRGPLNALLGALKDRHTPPERVKALGRQVAESLNEHRDRRYLRDSSAVVAEMLDELEARRRGEAVYPYGIEALDVDERTGKSRLAPGAKPGMLTVLTAVSGGGKALALDTPIATVGGWTTMGKIRAGDWVFDEAGEPCKVTWVSPVMTGRDCFEVVFADGEKIVADGEHLWKTRTARDRALERGRSPEGRAVARKQRGSVERRPMVSEALRRAYDGKRRDIGAQVRTTMQIRDTLRRTTKARVELNHTVEATRPLCLPTAALPLHPYLLGVWLGDGTTTGGHFTKHDPEIAKRISSFGYRVWEQRATKGRWTVGGLLVKLRAVGLLGNKHVPNAYLRASMEQRLEVVRGLMDTDGTASRTGAVSWCTTNPFLRDGFLELLATLGIKARASYKLAKIAGRVIGDSWVVHFTTDLVVFTLPRKAERVREKKRRTLFRRYVSDVKPCPSVPVRCVGVASPTSLFLAGRSMVPTHNSTLAARIALGQAMRGRRVLYGAWEMGDKISLELLAIMLLAAKGHAVSRTRFLHGEHSDEEQALVGKAAALVGQHVRFMQNPFGRQQKERSSNAANLDLIHQYVADTGADVVVCDLWDRCLVDQRPEEEKRALERTQAIAQETQSHLLLLAQQRLKDIETRDDPHPTREGIKGSSSWTDVGDTQLGIHRPAQFKEIPDDVLEIDVLKRRYGPYPQRVEVSYDPDKGWYGQGTTVPFVRATRQEGPSGEIGDFLDPEGNVKEPPAARRRGKRR